jgi:uncharacterized glyoxalase superfamily protein PhnB
MYINELSRTRHAQIGTRTTTPTTPTTAITTAAVRPISATTATSTANAAISAVSANARSVTGTSTTPTIAGSPAGLLEDNHFGNLFAEFDAHATNSTNNDNAEKTDSSSDADASDSDSTASASLDGNASDGFASDSFKSDRCTAVGNTALALHTTQTTVLNSSAAVDDIVTHLIQQQQQPVAPTVAATVAAAAAAVPVVTVRQCDAISEQDVKELLLGPISDLLETGTWQVRGTNCNMLNIIHALHCSAVACLFLIVLRRLSDKHCELDMLLSQL